MRSGLGSNYHIDIRFQETLLPATHTSFGLQALHYLPEGVGYTLTHDTSTSVIVHRAHP